MVLPVSLQLRKAVRPSLLWWGLAVILILLALTVLIPRLFVLEFQERQFEQDFPDVFIPGALRMKWILLEVPVFLVGVYLLIAATRPSQVFAVLALIMQVLLLYKDVLPQLTALGIEGLLKPDLRPPRLLIKGPEMIAPQVERYTVEASDNVAVGRVELWVDGILRETWTESPYAYHWNTRDLPDGRHTIKVLAIDKVGNSKAIEHVVVKK